ENNLSPTIIVSNEAEIYIAPRTITNIKVTPNKNKKTKKTVQSKKENKVVIHEKLNNTSLPKELPIIFYKTSNSPSQKLSTFTDNLAMPAPQPSSFKIWGVSRWFYYKNVEFKYYSEKNSAPIEFPYDCLYFSHFAIRPPPISGINFQRN